MDLAQKPVYKLDLAAGTSVVNLTTPLVEGDDRAQTFTLELTDKGAPANLNGYSVTAYFGRGKTAEAEADTIPVPGTVSGNVATITLTESCYSRSCYFSMPIRLSNGVTGQKRTYLIVRGTVVKSVDGEIIDPDGSVPSLDDLFAQIAVMERSRQAAEEATEEALAAAARADEAREGIQGDLATLTQENWQLNNFAVFKNPGKNLFNVNDPNNVKGYFLTNSNNLQQNANYGVSHYIKVEAGKTYCYTGGVGGAYHWVYDETVNPIYSVAANSSYTITIPENGAYMRVSYGMAQASSTMVEEGTESTAYEPYYADKVTMSAINDVRVNNEQNIKAMRVFVEPYNLAENPIETLYDVMWAGNKPSPYEGSNILKAYVTGGESYYISQLCGGRNGLKFFTEDGEYVTDLSVLPPAAWGQDVVLPDNVAIAMWVDEDYPNKIFCKSKHKDAVIAGKIGILNSNVEYGAQTAIHISASDGIDAFYNKMVEAFNVGNCDVYIGKGDYVYSNAFINAVRSQGKRGVPIGNGCRYYFETGAKLRCEYTGTNAADVVDLFSPLDSWNVGGSWEIYNLDLVAKNTCYALHDEANGADAFCRRVYKNCHIELDNTALGSNGNSISKALGGGLGRHEEVIIEDCVFKATNPIGNGNDASYHGANGSAYTDAKIVVTNSWFKGNFRVSDLEVNNSAPYPRVIYTGNSSGVGVSYPNTWDVYAWNNEVRGN